jgi:hypothetical protein
MHIASCQSNPTRSWWLISHSASAIKQPQTFSSKGLRHATARGNFQITADGFGPYVSAIENTLADRASFSQLIKVYRATPEGERKYSPAEVVSMEVVPVLGDPDPKRLLHVDCQAPKFNHADADAQTDALNKRLLKEVGQPLGRALLALRLLQLLPHPSHDSRYACKCRQASRIDSGILRNYSYRVTISMKVE